MAATPHSRRVAEILRAGNVVLAPMAGVAEAPFRGICKSMGAGLTYTEMISAKGLHYNPDSDASRELLTFSELETPCAVQLFGSEPQVMAEQAARICEMHGSDIALIDVNMGCPVSKVVTKGEGSALMRDPALASAIVTAVTEAVPVPVSVKFRKGWDDTEGDAVEFARAMEAAGASALAIHGRTRSQFYHGRADWDSIARVKDVVSVPVLGSGDVMCAADVKAMFDHTGVDGVMVARGAQGNPWIFRAARALLDEGRELEPPTPVERIEMAREHARALERFLGEHGVVRMRKHVSWYSAGMPGAASVRTRVNSCKTFAELDELLVEYRDYLERA